MKFLILLSAISFICGSPIADYQPRWNLVPDEEGKLYLIDSDPIVSVEPFFNAQTEIRFLLFTRRNRDTAQQITNSVESIRNSNFDSSSPVRVIIHGWNSGPEGSVNTAPTRSYMETGNFNVIQVDWSAGARTPNYLTARNRVGSVAGVLATLLNFFVDNNLIPNMQRVSIAGHSLGAHIAGLTGKNLLRNGRRLHTIWGLDPASALFSMNRPNERLDSDDAIYTEGIRTNIGGAGFTEPFCHTDFYPNGGARQPGCGTDITGQCSHSRAHVLFAESIMTNRFRAVRCNSLADARNQVCRGTSEISMGGEPGNTGARGIFSLRTNSQSPFAMG